MLGRIEKVVGNRPANGSKLDVKILNFDKAICTNVCMSKEVFPLKKLKAGIFMLENRHEKSEYFKILKYLYRCVPNRLDIKNEM